MPLNLSSETFRWWERRRLLYNVGLVVAGGLAFAAYVAVLIRFQDIIDGPNPAQADEFSGFVLFFQGVGYLFLMFVANICFFLGPLSEWWFRPRNVDAYRRIAFRLGFWCSVALPFGIPTLLLLLAIFYPTYWQRIAAAH